MKNIIVILAFVISLAASGQTSQNQSSYRTFLQMNADESPENDLYTALWQCYLDNRYVVSSAVSIKDSRYEETRDIIVNIWPYMLNAAYYYDGLGNRKKALQFAQAYVDISTSEYMKDKNLVKGDVYTTMVFYAASNTFNSGNYHSAIRYFQEYIATGEQKHLHNVLKYMAVACINVKDYERAKKVLSDAVTKYPTDNELLNLAVNACIESNDNKQLQLYVSKALAQKPHDANLLNIQGKLYEESGNYSDALKIFKGLFEKTPNSLTYAKHVALNNYNLGVLYANKAALEQDRRIAAQYDNQALMYFETAIPIIRDVVNADPASVKYHEALAVAYQMTGRGEELGVENRKIANLGGHTVEANTIPSLMAYSNNKSASSQPSSPQITSEEIPLYSTYAKQFVEESISKWQAKDPYETIDEYKNRVTVKSREAKIKELLKEAEGNYIRLYAKDININDFRLRPYDAEHEVFLAESEFGDVLIPVPRANNEARIFENSWNGTRCLNPRYAVDNDKIVIRGITFVTPMGNSYRFDDGSKMDYTQTEVDIQFEDIDYDIYENKTKGRKSTVKKEKVRVETSDVDRNIPVSKSVNDRTFAVVIANETYDILSSVPMAINDGKVFCQYCEKTLGLPKNHIRYYENATYGTMLHAIYDIQHIASAYEGDINVIFYYAGHGFPDESTRDAFLLPTDGDGIHTNVSYSLDKLYSELNGLGANNVYVFLDACFSGSNRDGSMLASARGVALKPKPFAPRGNMVIFSAASGEETAFPYEEKGHGMFTYFLLKKLQASKGNATIEEISEYVIENVRQQSVVINRKIQTPNISPSESLSESWKKLRLKP